MWSLHVGVLFICKYVSLCSMSYTWRLHLTILQATVTSIYLVNTGYISFLLLDLSAAVDIVNHNFCLHQPNIVLAWLVEYYCSRLIQLIIVGLHSDFQCCPNYLWNHQRITWHQYHFVLTGFFGVVLFVCVIPGIMCNSDILVTPCVPCDDSSPLVLLAW